MCAPVARRKSARRRAVNRGAGYQPTDRHGIKGTALAAHSRRRTPQPGCHAGYAAMSDSPAPTSPDEPPAEPAPPPPEPTPPPRERWRFFPWLTAAGFLILAAALVWVWQHPIMQPAPTEATDSLARQVSALEERVARLERRPAPTAPDLGSLAARVTALEQRPTPQAAPGAPAADLRPIEARVAALEQRPPADLQPLENKLAAAEARQQQTESGLSARIASLENADRTMQADLSRRTDAA